MLECIAPVRDAVKNGSTSKVSSVDETMPPILQGPVPVLHCRYRVDAHGTNPRPPPAPSSARAGRPMAPCTIALYSSAQSARRLRKKLTSTTIEHRDSGKRDEATPAKSTTVCHAATARTRASSARAHREDDQGILQGPECRDQQHHSAQREWHNDRQAAGCALQLLEVPP